MSQNRDTLRRAIAEVRRAMIDHGYIRLAIWPTKVGVCGKERFSDMILDTEEFIDSVCPPKLLRCPHCGQGGIFVSQVPELGADNPAALARPYYVKCQGCYAKTAASCDETEAINAWNKRYPLEADDEADERDD